LPNVIGRTISFSVGDVVLPPVMKIRGGNNKSAIEAILPKDAAECRRRAANCRQKAAAHGPSNALRVHWQDAADHWDYCAGAIEFQQDSRRQMFNGNGGDKCLKSGPLLALAIKHLSDGNARIERQKKIIERLAAH
jgi:hypothetical protein